MKRPHPLVHPILIFIVSLLALCLSLILYLHWYIKVTDNIESFVAKFKIEKELIFAPQSWIIILITSILVGCIMVGMAIIFTYYHKSQQLYRLQENFINNFTHELKTPLASIKLYLETFLKYELDPSEQKKFISYMLKDTQRLSLHVNQILQLANMENKTVNYPLQKFNVEEVIQNFLQQNSHIFQDGDIHLRNLDQQPIYYFLNLPLFEILLINLLTNSFKYNQNRPKIDIELFKKAGWTYLAFKDNGIGLEFQNQKKIFKKFFQVEGEERLTQRGSGLGLYLCYLIVKFHRGKIWVESPGIQQGSKFFVALPPHKKRFSKLISLNPGQGQTSESEEIEEEKEMDCETADKNTLS